MQVGNGMHDGCHEGHDSRQRKTLFRLQLPHALQVWPLNVIYEDIHPIALVIAEHLVDTRQRRVIKVPELRGPRGEALPLFSLWADHLLEGKRLQVLTHISHEIDGAKTALAQ